MTRFFFIFLITSLSAVAFAQSENLPSYATARGGRIFQVFQFPHDAIPRIDGDTTDWSMVPEIYTYGTQELSDTEDGMGTSIDPSDIDVKVTIGWVSGLNRLYFLYEAYDDYWDFGRFNPRGYLNDVFEIVVDGDLSGGPIIFNPIYAKDSLSWDSKTAAYLENHFSFSGVHAQNYHIFTPPVNQASTLIWGCQPWVSEFPYSNYAYNYSFEPGDSGRLVLEGWITPYDYAPNDGPKAALETPLFENRIIGLSWSVLDFDGDKREGHINLSHNAEMVKDASYLCAFRLMPLDSMLLPDIGANWSFKMIDMAKKKVAFYDESVGNVTEWLWDFGDGDTSSDQNPIHQFRDKGVHKVVTLEVKGPDGSSKKTRYWEVMIR